MMKNDQDSAGRTLWRRVSALPSLLAAATLFVLMTMTFFDVVLRSTINNPIEAATELTRLFMAIIVFSSLPIITWRSEHIVVDLLDPFFASRAARIRDIAVDLTSGAALLWPALRVWQLAARAHEYGDVTEYLQIPQFYIAYFIALATFCTAAALLVRAVLQVVAPRLVTRESHIPVALD